MSTTMIDHARRRAAPVLALAALTACGTAGPEGPTPGDRDAAATITAADIGGKITTLAHDSMRGRDTPSPELDEAAAFLADGLQAAGIQPAGEDGTYYHRFEYTMTRMDPEATHVRVAGSMDEPTYGVDYFLVPSPQPVQAPAFYMGTAGDAPPPPDEARGRILVYSHPGAELNQEWQNRLNVTLQGSMGAGAPGVIIILSPEFEDDMVATLAEATAQQQAPFPVVGIRDEAGRELVAALGEDLGAIEAAGEPAPLGSQALEIQGARTQESSSPPNVVGMLPGSDPELADTYIVMSAHFDHVGVGQPDETGDSIFNGADDNASGTSGILEVAEAFGALETAPARSVVFLFISGEEDGLLGSMAWVDDPTVDIGGIIANINMDMIGRNAPDTVIGIGQEYTTMAMTLDSILAAHPDLGLNVILDPNPEERYFFRSDQLPFIQRGIPAVFFNTGDHEDYHQQGDEAHKIDTDKAARIARLAFYLAHAIAMSPTAPEWTEEGRAAVEEMLGGSPF